MDAEEVLARMREMMAADAEAAAMDVMLHGRTILCITPDGIDRVPPEQFYISPPPEKR